MSSQAIWGAPVDTVVLPIEVLAHIFRATCCIDARFHITLRQVSRLCRDIARPLKYCSMFIQGREHLRFIVQQLTRYPANIPLVEHLALTDHNHSARRDTPGHESKPYPNRHPNVQMQITARPENHWEDNELCERDVSTLLDMVAPTLRTFHVAFYSPNWPVYLAIFRPKNGRVYPQLEEIAFRGPKSVGQTSTSEEEGNGIVPSRTGRTTFPRLQRLWLSHASRYSDGSAPGFFNDLAMACPKLTHLRLHEESLDTIHRALNRFMCWHGVQLGEMSRFSALIRGATPWDQLQNLDVVSVLQSNALLGFPHLQRLIIDLRPDARGRGTDLDKIYNGLMHAVARRRRDVVVRWCHGCTRARAPLSFMRKLFERSVGSDPELWHLENEVFQEEEAKRWQPIGIRLPTYRQSLTFRANIALGSDDWNFPTWKPHDPILPISDDWSVPTYEANDWSLPP